MPTELQLPMTIVGTASHADRLRFSKFPGLSNLQKDMNQNRTDLVAFRVFSWIVLPFHELYFLTHNF